MSGVQQQHPAPASRIWVRGTDSQTPGQPQPSAGQDQGEGHQHDGLAVDQQVGPGDLLGGAEVGGQDAHYRHEREIEQEQGQDHLEQPGSGIGCPEQVGMADRPRKRAMPQSRAAAGAERKVSVRT